MRNENPSYQQLSSQSGAKGNSAAQTGLVSEKKKSCCQHTKTAWANMPQNAVPSTAAALGAFAFIGLVVGGMIGGYVTPPSNIDYDYRSQTGLYGAIAGAGAPPIYRGLQFLYKIGKSCMNGAEDTNNAENESSPCCTL